MSNLRDLRSIIGWRWQSLKRHREGCRNKLLVTKQRWDEEIDYSDIPELGDDFFRQAEVWMPPEKRKEQLTVRFDADIVDWGLYGNPARPRTRTP